MRPEVIGWMVTVDGMAEFFNAREFRVTAYDGILAIHSKQPETTFAGDNDVLLYAYSAAERWNIAAKVAP